MVKFLLCSPEQATSIDEQSGSIFKLNNGIILYLRQINKFMALVCILREYNFTRQGIIDYNFLCFHDAVHKLFTVRMSKQSAAIEFNQIEDDEEECDDEVNGYMNGNTNRLYEKKPFNYQSNSQLTNYLLAHKFNNKSLQDLN